VDRYISEAHHGINTCVSQEYTNEGEGKINWLILVAYVMSYLIFRNASIEIWEKDAGEWINFNKSNVWIYYFYRPLICVDSNLTSLRFYFETRQ
jgi:hypothetical protein